MQLNLSIVIVNYKSPQLIVDCLQTIFVNGTSDGPEVIVVDNSARDGSKEQVMARFPSIKWVEMEYNSGFARANNTGIRLAKNDTVLLLNPDTLNEGNAIAQCYQRLTTGDHIAAGVQLLNEDRTPQVSGNYFMKGGLNHLMALPYTGRWIRWVGLVFKVKKTNVPEAKGTVEVDWINGAFLMVKKLATESSGLLDEDFFLYSEEIEWCSRLKKKGTLCIYGDLHVIHLQGESANAAFDSSGKGYSNLSDLKGGQIMLSGFVRIRKQFGAGWFLFHLFTYLFTIPVFFIIALLRTLLFFSARKREWNAFGGFTRNVFRCCGYCFTILRNKPHFYKLL
ncbi:MAG: glycosyltransferase family 2 protein [Chitinophagaceae bacterium]